MTAPVPVLGTIVFTDLVGFTSYTDTEGDGAALAVLDRQLSLVRDVLAPYAGARVVKEIGDGLMLWFASAVDAVAAAGRLRDRLEHARDDGFPLALRIGVHTGEALPRGDDDLIGGAVNIASRIADAAGPGEILGSETTLTAARANGATISPRPVGAVYVKGIAEPVWLSAF